MGERMDETAFDETLKTVQEAIRQIQKKNDLQVSYIDTYTNIHRLVHRHFDQCYERVREVIRDHIKGDVRGKVMGASDDRLFDTLLSEWSDHKAAMEMVSKVCSYIDIRVEYLRADQNWRRLELVYDLGNRIFRETIVCTDRVTNFLRKVLLEMVARDRTGGVVEWSGIKSAVSMIVDVSNEETHLYKEIFETQFLKDTEEFYKGIGHKLLEENCASGYVKKVESCIKDETERAARYLAIDTKFHWDWHPGDMIKHTKNELLKVLEDVLISQNMQTVVDMEKSGLKFMLREDKVTDMRALYLLLRRVDGGITVMVSRMSKYLRAVGGKLVGDGGGEGAEPGNATARKDPVRIIQDLIDLKEKFDRFLNDAFDNDSSFKKKIDADFDHFINKTKYIPEFLALYLNEKLQKGQNLSNDQMKRIFDRSMTLFGFLTEKFEFLRQYKKHYARRVLKDQSVSDDAEKQMIMRMRTAKGYDFTAHLEKMFKDKENWKGLNKGFTEFCWQKGLIHQMDVNVRLLAAGIWPTQSAAPICSLPDPCQTAFDHFKRYYKGTHSGRKISLHFPLGSADVKAVFYGANAEGMSEKESDTGTSSREPVYTTVLQVETYTMIVLLTFNSRPKATFNQLQLDTKIPERDLKRSLHALCMRDQRVLKRRGKGAEIEGDDEFSVNEKFTSNLARFRIQYFMQTSDTKEEKTEIDGDRKHEVEAAIVRIMKARRTRMHHNELVVKVIEQLQSRFKPDVQMIKMTIESLIEREYLVRSYGNHQVYQYQA